MSEYYVSNWSEFSQKLQDAVLSDTIILTKDIDCANETIKKIVIGDAAHSINFDISRYDNKNTITIEGNGHKIKNLVYDDNDDNVLFTGIHATILFKDLEFKNLVLGEHGKGLFGNYIPLTEVNSNELCLVNGAIFSFLNCYFDVMCNSLLPTYADSQEEPKSGNRCFPSIFISHENDICFYFLKCAFDIMFNTIYASFIHLTKFVESGSNFNIYPVFQYCNIQLQCSNNIGGIEGASQHNGVSWFMGGVCVRDCFISGNLNFNVHFLDKTDADYDSDEYCYDQIFPFSFENYYFSKNSYYNEYNITPDELPNWININKHGFTVFNINTKFNLFSIDESTGLISYKNGEDNIIFNSDRISVNEVSDNLKYKLYETLYTEKNLHTLTDSQLKSSEYLKTIGMSDEWYVNPNVNGGYPWNDNIPKLKSDLKNIRIGNNCVAKCFNGNKEVKKVYIH